MNLKNKLYISIFIAILVALLLISPYLVSAGCCVKPDTCEVSSGICTGGIFNSADCGTLSDCNEGCCCSADGISYHQYQTRSGCTYVNPLYLFTVLPRGDVNDNCISFCNPSTTYTVSGYVKNATNSPLSGVNVSFLAQTYTTGADGSYQLINLPSIASITAAKSGCDSKIVSLNLPVDAHKDIVLNCFSCWWNCTDWATIPCNPATGTKTRPACTRIPSLSQCPDNLISQPAPPIVTSCEIQTTCGDNKLDSGEDCEINQTDRTKLILGSNCAGGVLDCMGCKCITHTVPPDPCLSDPGNISLTASFIKHSLQFGLSWSSSCTNYLKNYTLEKCEGKNCNTWSQIFTGKSTSFTDAYPYINQEKTYCYKITAYYDDRVSPLNPSNRIKSNWSCFYSGDSFCFSGRQDPDCYSSQEGEQIINGIIQCDTQNKASVSNCNLGNYCAFQEGQPICKNQSDCEKCNGAFGVFGYQGYSIFLDEENRPYCPTLTSPYTAGLPGCYLDYTKTSVDMIKQCSEVKSCYDYFSRDSCVLDYCGKFIGTGILNNLNGCEWIPYNKQFNKGVCRPKNEEQQDCSLCNVDASNRFYNDCTKDTCVLYGGNSSGNSQGNIQGPLGIPGTTSCYFNSADSECLNKRDMTCGIYETKEDCIGPVGNAKTTEVKVDTLWGFLAGRYIKTSGTNTLLNASTDFLSLGRCKWSENYTDPINSKCIKDADNSTTTDCSEFMSASVRKKCEKDTIPPVTTILNRPVYNKIINLTNSLTVLDNVWYFEETPANIIKRVNLTYCIAPIDSPQCYPNLPVNRSLSLTYPRQYWFEIPDGETAVENAQYTVYYFASDPAKNLEKIKNFTFELDTIPPVILVNRTNRIVKLAENEYRTNITFDITLNTERNPPVLCSLVFRSLDNSANIHAWMSQHDLIDQQITNIGNTISTKYPDLTDGDYLLQLNCRDIAGNVNDYCSLNPNECSIRIEGDKRVFSATPRGSTFRISTLPNDISLLTESPAECRYSETEINYADMANAFTNNNINTNCGANSASGAVCYNHTESLNTAVAAAGGSITASRAHIFYTACKITSSQAIAENDLADAIYFAIDELAPNSNFSAISNDMATAQCDENNENCVYEKVPYNSSAVTNYMEITPMCNDSDPSLYSIVFGKDLSFGCGKTYYCIGRNSDVDSLTSCANFSNYHEYTDTIILDYLDTSENSYYKTAGNYPKFCYYSADKGNNAEQTHCTTLSIRNTLFNQPTITILYINSSLNPIMQVTYDEHPVYIADSGAGSGSYSLINSRGVSYPLTKISDSLNQSFNFTPQAMLFNGDYVFSVSAQDQDYNIVEASALFNFNKSGMGMGIELIAPKFGIASTQIFNITVLTEERSICRYGRFQNENFENYSQLYNSMYYAFDQTDAKLSNITNFDKIPTENDFQQWTFVCKKNPFNNSSAQPNDSNEMFAALTTILGYDTTAPTMSVTANPETIFDWNHRWTNITVTTDENTVCSIETAGNPSTKKYFTDEDPDNFFSYNKKHSIIMDYSGIRELGPLHFDYTVRCVNLAQLELSQAQGISWLINNSLTISRNCPYYANSSSFDFGVLTSIQATCNITYEGSSYQTGPATEHSLHVGEGGLLGLFGNGLSEGINTFNVKCFTSTGPEAEKSFEVYLDTVHPTLSIIAHENSCSLTKIKFTLQANDSSGSGTGISKYNYTIMNSSGDVLIARETTSKEVSETIHLTEGETYTIIAYAFDNAGNPSDQASAQITATSSGGTECDFTNPILGINKITELSDENNVFINVTCRDSDSGCSDSFRYALLSNVFDSCFGENASYDEKTYSELPLQLTEEGKLCVTVFDNNENNASGSIIIALTILECGNGIIEPQNNEQCDRTQLGNINGHGASCVNFDSFTRGILRCDANCHWDTSNCDVGYGYCGDNEINNFPNEQCDGNDWGSLSSSGGCEQMGFSGGTLGCNPPGSIHQCNFNTSRCSGVSGTCGNGILNTGEDCENINQLALFLNCTDFDSFSGGDLSCAGCRYDISQCTPPLNITGPEERCGDGIIVPGEQCDGTDTGEIHSCEDIGFNVGELKCGSNCLLAGCGSDEVVTSELAGNTFDCNNYLKDGDETDVDCGGSCYSCELYKSCMIDADCYSRNCLQGVCTESSCTDAKQDGKEIGIDCGGDCMTACPGEETNEQPNVTTDASNYRFSLIIILIGILIVLSSGGYIIYKSYFDKSKKNKSGGMGGISSSSSSQQSALSRQPVKSMSEIAQEKQKLELQKQKLLKRQQDKTAERKSIFSSFGSSDKEDAELHKISERPEKDSLKDKENSAAKSEKERPTEKTIEKNKSSRKKEDIFEKLESITKTSSKQTDKSKSSVKSSDSSKTAFEKLDEIGKGVSKSELSSKLASLSGKSESKINAILKTNSLTHTDTAELFRGLTKKEITSDVFKEVISSLVSSGKLSKETVSSVLFEFMDQGMLSRADVAKTLKDLKLI